MAFLCPSRVGRVTKEKKKKVKDSQILGRITGSDSVDTLVRVGLEKQHGLSPDSKMVVLKNFAACAEKELGVSRGQEVYLLYRENDWSYVITIDGKEGFIPSSYVLGVSSNSSGSHRLGRHEHNASPKSNTDIISDIFDSDSCITGDWPEVTSSLVERLEPPPYSNIPTREYENWNIVPEVKPFRKTLHGQFIALFDFQALDENDVSVERAELVQVLNIEDPDWSWVRKYNDLEGFVPKSYICPVEPLKAQEKLAHHYQNTTRSPSKSSTPAIRQPLISINDPRRLSYSSERSIPRVPVRPSTLPISSCYRNEIKDFSNFADYQKQISRQPQYRARSRSTSPGRSPRSASPSSSSTKDFYHTRQSSVPDFSQQYIHNSGKAHSSGLSNDYRIFSERNEHALSDNSFGQYRSISSSPSSSQGYSRIHFPAQGQSVGTTNHKTETPSVLTNKNDNKLEQYSISNQGQNDVQSDVTELVMLYDYSNDIQSDFSLKSGETVYIDTLEQNDPHWFWVYHPSANKYGYVPRNYVKSTMLKTRL